MSVPAFTSAHREKNTFLGGFVRVVVVTLFVCCTASKRWPFALDACNPLLPLMTFVECESYHALRAIELHYVIHFNFCVYSLPPTPQKRYT